MLADDDFGVGFSHTDHFRGVSPQIGRQLAVIRGQGHAGKTETVEHIRIEVVFTHRQARLECRQCPVGIKAAPFQILSAPGAVVIDPSLPVGTQPPWARIGSHGAVTAQPHARVAVVLMNGLRGEVVIHQQTGHAFIPARGRIPVLGGVLQIRLRQGDMQG